MSVEYNWTMAWWVEKSCEKGAHFTNEFLRRICKKNYSGEVADRVRKCFKWIKRVTAAITENAERGNVYACAVSYNYRWFSRMLHV